MSVSVDIPGYGSFDIPLAASRTAGDILLLLRDRLPDSPWHGNKVLSSGVCQLRCDDVVEAPSHSNLVLTNYSEISNQETHVLLSSFFPAERFSNTKHPESKVLAHVAKHDSETKPMLNIRLPFDILNTWSSCRKTRITGDGKATMSMQPWTYYFEDHKPQLPEAS